MQIALGTVFGHAAHDFMRLLRCGRDLSTIQIDGQRRITLVRQLRCLLFDPVVEPPPFVDHDNSGERPLACRRVKHRLDGFIATLIGDAFAVCGESGNGKQNRKQQNHCPSHHEPPLVEVELELFRAQTPCI